MHPRMTRTQSSSKLRNASPTADDETTTISLDYLKAIDISHGVYPLKLKEIYVKAGEMVALQCRQYRRYNHNDAKLTWTSYTTQKMDLTNMSSAEQRQMDVLVHERSLVILRASVNHQGNYSCSLGNASSQCWFRLTVYTTLSKEYKERIQYSKTCYTQESCRLDCPAVNVPAENTPNITSNNIIWHKEGESLPEDGYYFNKGRVYSFSSVEEKDQGVYTCTRSYLYLDQIYNMSFTTVLKVKPKNDQKHAVIKSPHENPAPVDLGSMVVIPCIADFYSEWDYVFWFSGDSFVETNNSSSVFYNLTWDKENQEMTATLVFKKVSEEDLSKNYTCKLQSASQSPSYVTITLARKSVYPLKLKEIYVKAGEMVALQCRQYRRYNHNDAKLTWTSYTTQKMDLTNRSSAEQRQMDVLVHERSLVILRASVNHQGNYSCSLGNASSQCWFRLTVYTTLSKEYKERIQYSKTCYTQESCRLDCPAVNVPAENTPNITSNNIIWHKEGESLPEDGYYFNKGRVYSFSSVEEKDQGVYTCTRSYLYLDQIYNMSFTTVLKVKPKNDQKHAVIKSPHENDVFPVDLGSMVVIPCIADFYSEQDNVFWFSGDSFVETNNSSSVFYNLTRDKENQEMTATLVFKKVSEEDLSKNYTCKLQSASQSPSYVTIFLTKKTHPSYVPLTVSIVGIVVVMVVTVVIYVEFKIEITLFLRETHGCHSITSDGKSYDAFLMCYKSNTDAGLDAHDRKWLENVLEEKFGYSLCLFDRDVLPGKAVADAVLDCIEQSRTVVLVPTSPDLGPDSGLLSAIHEALVERQSRLVFIKTEAKEVSRSGSLPEVLQHLGKAGHCVTWKGTSSMTPSSSFWKQLRYYLPATQHAPKLQLLPQTIQDVNSR
ncbi:interleukin-18 receptor 1-like isoform X3 [Thunnus thynnus]|uniref:interleukin-18 receptor 1-like isoform X3 n=1 Tax=Thunnus thynnus TaxID=8237 RepID=UPI00352941D4